MLHTLKQKTFWNVSNIPTYVYQYLCQIVERKVLKMSTQWDTNRSNELVTDKERNGSLC